MRVSKMYMSKSESAVLLFFSFGVGGGGGFVHRLRGKGI